MTQDKQNQPLKQWLREQLKDHGEVYLLASMVIAIWIYIFLTSTITIN